MCDDCKNIPPDITCDKCHHENGKVTELCDNCFHLKLEIIKLFHNPKKPQ